MTPLLIYADNLSSSFVKLFNNRKIVRPSTTEIRRGNFNYDIFLHNRLKEIFTEREFDSIIIPYSLNSENYLEYNGLTIACHIRLTAEFKHQNKPIFFIGYDKPEHVAKFSNHGFILFTPGIYLISDQNENGLNEVKKLVKENPFINNDDFQLFLDKINIKPPANYLSHHSISNEWSILRWAKILEISENEESILRIKENIEGLLYFKYLLAKYPIVNEKFNTSVTIQGNGSVLYIDDEWDKGWKIIFEKVFTKNKFLTLEENFKSSTQKEVIELISEKVKKEKPNLIILDLRLCDGDFLENISPKNLTGYKALRSIKDINPGIQVIIFTASNKVWNLLELQSAGANGFIVKESPEHNINLNYTKESIGAFKTLIEKTLNEIYLIDVWEDFKSIINHLEAKKSKREISSNYYKAIKSYLNNIFNTLKSINNETKFETSFFFAFLILEASSKEFIDEENPINNNDGNSYGNYSFNFRRTSNPLKAFDIENENVTQFELRSKNIRINYNQKFLNLIYHFTSQTTTTFKFINKRNNFFHPDLIKNNNTENIVKQDLLDLLDVVKKVLLAI